MTVDNKAGLSDQANSDLREQAKTLIERAQREGHTPDCRCEGCNANGPNPAFPSYMDLLAELEAVQQERDKAMAVLAPNMPSSGLVDACRQVKQAAISEADNSEKLEAQLTAATQELENARQEIERYAVAFGAGAHAYPEVACRTILDAELTALVARAEATTEDQIRWKVACHQTEEQLIATVQELARVRQYAQHKPSCFRRTGCQCAPYESCGRCRADVCTCGFDDLKRGLEQGDPTP